MPFSSSVVYDAFKRAGGRCELCGKELRHHPVLDEAEARMRSFVSGDANGRGGLSEVLSGFDVCSLPDFGWTVTQYHAGCNYALSNAFVVCLDCHTTWFRVKYIQHFRKKKPLGSREIADILAFFAEPCVSQKLQRSCAGWFMYVRYLKAFKRDNPKVPVRPLSLLSAEERVKRLKEAEFAIFGNDDEEERARRGTDDEEEGDWDADDGVCMRSGLDVWLGYDEGGE